ncbi:ATP-binding cassette domain-containing protein [Eggerthellaceae bacterium zg-887]|uniref:ABC transporter ATP-binding protein n=1 Tax=Xiamenia xianingshaonis TaxID=2682776 RepID=UPI00140AFF1D|nr:ABC transporter ATP-binding protein [Xiamenia xianingshaonis]NHM16807.1 ATP-binding cassette domain-containing protein [Xiamenia xianingshaonis]
MLRLIHQIMLFAGSYAPRIRVSYIFAFLKSLCANGPVIVAIVLVNMLLEGTLEPSGCVVAGVVLLLLIVLQSVFQNIVDRLQSAAGYLMFADARMKLATHLRHLPMGYFTAGNLGKISSVLSADMVFVEEQSMDVLSQVISDVFAQIIIVAFMFWLHPIIGFAALATVFAAVVVAQFMNREALGESVNRQQAIEQLTGAVLEYAEGIAVNKSFNRAGVGARELREAFAESRDHNLSFERFISPWQRALLVIYAIGMSAVVALCVWLYGQGAMEPGNFIGVMFFAFSLFAPLKHMYSLDGTAAIMKVSLDRVQSVLDEEEIEDNGKKVLPASSEDVPEIEFRNVSFSYEDEEVLHDVSFTVHVGETVALVGQSGSGKTTLTNLLARFWDVSSGQVLVRGVDVRELSSEVLMGVLSMVFQRVYLFEDTVRANLSMGAPEASDKRIVQAAEKAQCLNFIMKLPYGFDTVIGEGASTLSGGEAQRLSIARCILKDAPIVILDEATANLDADNESAIQQAMSELCRDKTTIVIAHHLSTIMSADKIVVLDSGRVAEMGSHEELIARDGMYAKIVAAELTAGVWSSCKEEA